MNTKSFDFLQFVCCLRGFPDSAIIVVFWVGSNSPKLNISQKSGEMRCNLTNRGVEHAISGKTLKLEQI
jgi:hypothetical protein